MAEKKDNEELLESSPFSGDLESRLAVQPKRSFSTLTLGLAVGVTLVVGVIGGIQAEKALGGSSEGTSAGARVPGAPQGGMGGYGGQRGGMGGEQGGMGGGGQRGGMGGMTVGTVEKVEGDKVYVKTMDGSVVTVTTTGETSVRIAKEGKVADLQQGGSIVVQGAKGEDGAVTATSISEGNGRR